MNANPNNRPDWSGLAIVCGVVTAFYGVLYAVIAGAIRFT